ADREGALQCGYDGRMAVAQEQRPPRTDVIDVLIAIRIEDMGAFAARDKRRVAADAAKGADRGVYTAGDQLLRAPEEVFGLGTVHMNSLLAALAKSAPSAGGRPGGL